MRFLAEHEILRIGNHEPDYRSKHDKKEKYANTDCRDLPIVREIKPNASTPQECFNDKKREDKKAQRRMSRTNDAGARRENRCAFRRP